MFRLATFNLEKLGDGRDAEARLRQRIAVLRPQLSRLDADIVCLQEVNAQRHEGAKSRELDALKELLRETEYARYPCIASGLDGGAALADVDNIVVLSRYPIENFETVKHRLIEPPLYRRFSAHPPDAAAQSVRWDRPVLRVLLTLPGGRRLHLINVHLRAPTASYIPGAKQGAWSWTSVEAWAEGYFISAMKRAGQALETRLLVDGIFREEPDALIAVCGDLNARANEVPMKILIAAEEDTGNAELVGRTLVPLERSLPADRRYTVLYQGHPEMLDHILVSRSLLASFRGLEIHNETLEDETAVHAHIAQPLTSFHAPMVASFELD
jgi:endonuclease/exonuclease/phosphatase family metal-dependent hydrolase